MNVLVKISCVDKENIGRLRHMFFDGVTSRVRSLVNIGIKSQTYGSLLYPVILEKLPKKFRLIISRKKCVNNKWDLTKALDLINIELKEQEALVELSQSMTEGSNDLVGPYADASLSFVSQRFKNKKSQNKGIVRVVHSKAIKENVFFVKQITDTMNVVSLWMCRLRKIC